jgi:hypothetical protein
MRWRSIVSWLGFQAVWLSCALGAAEGRNWPGIVAASLFLGGIVATSPGWRSAMRLAAAGGLSGTLIETSLIAAGLVRYSAPWPVDALAPAWIVALWIAFGATVPSILGILGSQRLAMAAALGAVSGPLAYLAGERLGALHIARPAAVGLLVLAFVWAAVFTGLVALASRCDA